MISRAYHSCPLVALEALSAVSNISDFLRYSAVSASHRLLVNSHWETDYFPFSPGQFTSHAFYVDSWRKAIPFFSWPVDSCPLVLMIDRPFSVTISGRDESIALAPSLISGIVVFTDGSKMDSLTGTGFIIHVDGDLLIEDSIQFFRAR